MLKLEPSRGAPTRWAGDPEKLALLMAGGAYAPARPLLHYLRKVLQQHGWTVQELWWQPPHDEWDFTDTDGRQEWVVAQAEAALSGETASRQLLCGKSLASFAAPVAAERGLSAIWLTPVLSEARNAGALLAASAPTLLVGGTEDYEYWDGEAARRSGHSILELPGLGHSLEVPDAVRSIDIVRQVTVAAGEFLDKL